MAQAQKSIEVNVAKEKFFDIITNYAAYPEFLTAVGLRKVSVDRVEGNAKVVTQEVEVMGTRVSYTVRMVEERPSKVSWTLVKGQMMSINSGSWVLEELGPAKTRATYSLELKLGFLVPSAITTRLAASSLPAMLDAFKQRAESLVAS